MQKGLGYLIVLLIVVLQHSHINLLKKPFLNLQLIGNLATERTYGLYGDMSKRKDLNVEPAEIEKQRLAEEEQARLEKKKAETPSGFKPSDHDLSEFEKHRERLNKEMAEAR